MGGQSWVKSKGGAHLEDGYAHDAHAVVGQQLHFDIGCFNKGQGDAANIGAHGRQPQLDPHLALQVKIAHKHWQLHSPNTQKPVIYSSSSFTYGCNS